MSKDAPMIFDEKNYVALLESVKARILSSQHQVARYVNSELLFTFWTIGHSLNQERDRQGWGAKVVDQLAKDLKTSFPSMKGLSKRNLQYMMRFATEWPIDTIVQPPAAQLESKEVKAIESAESLIVPPAVAQIQDATIVQPVVAQFQFNYFHFKSFVCN